MKGNIDIFKENEYITTGDFAKILNMNDSTVRYYSTEFKDFLNISKVKKRRFFKAEDVEKFIYLKYLVKKKRLPVKLAKDFLATELVKA